MTVEKTLAMKVLEGKKVPYEVVTFPDDMHDAEQIAELLGVEPELVFKTLVVNPPAAGQKPLLVMVPANRQLDLKQLAAALKAKKVRMAAHREAEEMTGLQVGGISALALLNRGFTVYLDESAKTHDAVYVSAGKRGINLKVPVRDLIKVTGARLIHVAE
ncbi:MAG: aminoacyl-tRNA deacylase [Chloroflexota bacterium]